MNSDKFISPPFVCSNFNIAEHRDTPGHDISSDKDFYHDYSNERIKIYHCTVSNNNPVT